MKTTPSDIIRLLAEPGSRIVAAVSGGSDSVALLHILASAAGELGLQIYAAHFNHGLRGAESDGDEAFTKALSASLGIVCIARPLDVKGYARRRGLATEEAARLLRYEALGEIKESLGADYIATAHTADDRAETVLLNIIRGTGLGGLYPLPAKRGCFLRPLTAFSKDELKGYLAENGLSFRTDSTNLTDFCRRNMLRNRVIPLLEKEFNPSLRRALEGLGELAEEADRFIRSETRRFMEDAGTPVPVESLLEQPAIIRYSAIRELIKEAKGEYKDITLGEIKRADGLLSEGPFKTELTGGGLYAVSDGRFFRVEKKGPGEETAGEYLLEPEGSVRAGKYTVRCEAAARKGKTGKIALYAADTLFPLRIAFATREIRRLYMEPVGMEGKHKKISRILKDMHISENAGSEVLVFFDCSGRPLWIPGCTPGAQIKTKGKALYRVTLV
ncbi:MAG: tRNA lysidine(34) synthetase TilS [Abditibacteriota bacterium]|nr:tRNA lysidine(34) synthetase TilS [Abditibacteriota bacterium]